jgi:hypothetical protein
VKPSQENRWRLGPKTVEGGFEAWPSLDELFPINFQGVNHNRGLEGGIIDTDRAALEQRLRAYFAAERCADPLRTACSMDGGIGVLLHAQRHDGRPHFAGLRLARAHGRALLKPRTDRRLPGRQEGDVDLASPLYGLSIPPEEGTPAPDLKGAKQHMTTLTRARW